jgi:hypothetical protein
MNIYFQNGLGEVQILRARKKMSKRKEIDTGEELSVSKRTRSDAVSAASMTWLLLYFGSAVGCDMPILEALFHTVALPCQNCKKRVNPENLRWQTCPSCRELRPCMLCCSRNDDLHNPPNESIHFLDKPKLLSYGFYPGCRISRLLGQFRFRLCPVHALINDAWGWDNPFVRILPSEINRLFGAAHFGIALTGKASKKTPPIAILDDNNNLRFVSSVDQTIYDPLYPFAVLEICSTLERPAAGDTYTDKITTLENAAGNKLALDKVRTKQRAANLGMIALIAQIQQLAGQLGDGHPEPACPPLACSRCAATLSSASKSLHASALSSHSSSNLCCTGSPDLCEWSYHIYKKTELFCDRCALK